MKIFLIIALLLASGWCTAQSDPGTQSSGGKKSSANRPFVGQTPNFALPTLDGGTLKRSDLRGRVVILNFWSTFGEACRIQISTLVELQNEYGSQELQVVGVDLEDAATTEDIVALTKEMKVNYPIVIGNELVAKKYGGIPVLPTSAFLDRDGKIIALEFGVQDRSVMVDQILKALGPGFASKGTN